MIKDCFKKFIKSKNYIEGLDNENKVSYYKQTINGYDIANRALVEESIILTITHYNMKYNNEILESYSIEANKFLSDKKIVNFKLFPFKESEIISNLESYEHILLNAINSI